MEVVVPLPFGKHLDGKDAITEKPKLSWEFSENRKAVIGG